jgi:hypothetical protein
LKINNVDEAVLVSEFNKGFRISKGFGSAVGKKELAATDALRTQLGGLQNSGIAPKSGRKGYNFQ